MYFGTEAAQHNLLLKLADEEIGKLKIFVFPGKQFPGGIDHAGDIATSGDDPKEATHKERN